MSLGYFENTPIEGKVVMKLDLSTINDAFILSVSDSGTGIPKKKRNKLFVRFEQMHYASDGIGVGLYLTSELAKVHQGHIEYTDSEVGGACFLVSIPLSESNDDKADIIEASIVERSILVNVLRIHLECLPHPSCKLGTS